LQKIRKFTIINLRLSERTWEVLAVFYERAEKVQTKRTKLFRMVYRGYLGSGVYDFDGSDVQNTGMRVQKYCKRAGMAGGGGGA
jgi:hypothetical protein